MWFRYNPGPSGFLMRLHVFQRPTDFGRHAAGLAFSATSRLPKLCIQAVDYFIASKSAAGMKSVASTLADDHLRCLRKETASG